MSDSSTSERFLIAVFCLSLLAPGVAMFAWPESSIVPGENRAQISFDPRSATFGDDVDAYFRDHLGFRRDLVGLHRDLRFGLFETLSTDMVLLGREDWLFVRGDFGFDSLRNTPPFDEQSLDQWQRYLSAAQRFCARNGSAFLFVIVPNKSSIYGDYLPEGAVPVHPNPRASQLAERLRSAGINVLDLSESLAAASREIQTYRQFDSHWNGYGALVGYQEMLRGLERYSNRSAALQPIPHRLDAAMMDGDLAHLIGKSEWREEYFSLRAKSPSARRVVPVEPPTIETRGLQIYENESVADFKAIFFRDSFATALLEILPEQFSRSVWVWSRELSPDLIREERADVVVFEVVERYLMAPVPNNPFPRTSRHVAKDVPDAADYALVYRLDLPDVAGFNRDGIEYTEDHSDRIDFAFDRVAFHLELQRPGEERRFVYVSLPAPSRNVADLGVPHLASGAVLQQLVDDLYVVSNHPALSGLETVETGSLEFWPSNYGQNNSLGVPGAEDARFDGGDHRASGAGYGSMQIHDANSGQTLFSYNGWGQGDGVADLGIARNTAPGGQPDWTFARNADRYTLKTLRVLVRPELAP